MELKKIGKIDIKDEPYLKPISDLDIGFYNLDNHTAVLRFYITKDNHPLLVSDKNATTYVYLESSNGSNQIVEDIAYINPMKGLVEITIPIEFLQASTGTAVTGQIYISVHNVDDPADANTVALNEFTFSVADAKINKINGATKISYIRMFDELKKSIGDREKEIQEKLDNMEDYITKVEEKTDEGVKEIDTKYKNAYASLSKLGQTNENEINEALNAALSTLNNTTNDNYKKITDIGTQHLRDIRAEKTDIENLLNSKGFVKNETLAEMATDLTQSANELIPEVSDWITYDLNDNANKNKHYKMKKQNGFDCAYKTIQNRDYKMVSVRLNADTFESGDVIAKLPENIVTHTHTAFIRAVPQKAYGAQLVLEPTGELKVWISNPGEWEADASHYIYGETCFIE
ncbi:BppU family phage baseplate upper protein [Staphylococcus auricularis]|uniref:BppU family phage baseplate upper protein n=1 Tax=Staphylococcus auricularis TaxID=29379 RepID=UPI002DB8BFF7|nr:BppU family phage baseplate upper protein [Staphylococcus auricularis]MEB6569089.1 BppU family phage baseplate upper protein [Staphylococcus auricularis]